jgi:hypothetical protein
MGCHGVHEMHFWELLGSAQGDFDDRPAYPFSNMSTTASLYTPDQYAPSLGVALLGRCAFM